MIYLRTEPAYVFLSAAVVNFGPRAIVDFIFLFVLLPSCCEQLYLIFKGNDDVSKVHN